MPYEIFETPEFVYFLQAHPRTELFFQNWFPKTNIPFFQENFHVEGEFVIFRFVEIREHKVTVKWSGFIGVEFKDLACFD